MKKLSLLFFFSIAFLITGAQTSPVNKAQTFYDKAQGYLQNNNYQLAISNLNETVKADPNFQFAFIQLADINRRIKDYSAAKAAYHSAIDIGPIKDIRMYYGVAEAEINTGDYTRALQHINLFLNNYKGDDQDFIKKAKKYLEDCQFSIEAVKHPIKYEPINLGPNINSTNRDYFPAVTADGTSLIFCRKIEDNEDFYISKKEGSLWGVPISLSNKINTQNFNEGAQSISPDGMYLFFTGCNRPDGLGRCDIYMSHREGNTWGTPFNLGNKVNSQYWESQPAISPDGSTLYFVSNRPGGIGGYDIWKSILQDDGYWGTPVNMGAEINTPYDEHTPFIHPDGKTLYFSSDGWPGLGNKDIFLSRIEDSGQWSKPVNMGYPINTFNEETGLIVTPDGSQALFSSDLKGGYGDMDIYSFMLPEDKKPRPITYVKGVVKDKTSGKYLDAEVRIVDLREKTLIYNDYTSNQTGEFLAVMPVGSSYAFNVSADGYLFYSENYKLTNQSISSPYLVTIELSKPEIGSNLVLKNIFFETNQFELLPESLTELNQLAELLKNNPTLAIEIQGHTDNIGNDATNQHLSLNRAKAVYNHLINNKISAGRLTFKGFGKEKPVAPNQTEEGRQKNRRTSFVITGV